MRRWLGAALLCCGGAVALAAWWVESEPSPPGAAPQVRAAEPAPPPWPAALPVAPVAALAAAPLAPPVAAAPEAPPADAASPSLAPLEAQMLMQLMLERGDPRSPALGELEPRPRPSAAVLADPAQYQAFEDRHSRAQIQAYAGGVQQIPAIRERIEQAAQSGERNAAELDEARAALEQLEMLKAKLQREAPELLPGTP
ncbi:hypothetical protein SBP02_20530 [Pseudomonas benzenivorans]|uniref:Phospholipase C accessory protein PlcR n=1 Tax=Pseudomonas benzenivorans TaxID=556533 RepID=A0ABZ0PW28_9PSED|nr:hypothetical protein [Pseudomonas benzenivorans]WPC05110.1 hypothetical protein SBP02_20530 [Pseudomonas benzenivorans]